MSFCTLVFPKFYVVPLRFLKFYFLPWRFRNFLLYPLVFEILSHALDILKFLNDALRFLGFWFFLCLFFSFFSLFSFSLFHFISVVTETMHCFLVLPSHLVCRFLLLLLLPSFVLAVSLRESHHYVSSLC